MKNKNSGKVKLGFPRLQISFLILRGDFLMILGDIEVKIRVILEVKFGDHP